MCRFGGEYRMKMILDFMFNSVLLFMKMLVMCLMMLCELIEIGAGFISFIGKIGIIVFLIDVFIFSGGWNQYVLANGMRQVYLNGGLSVFLFIAPTIVMVILEGFLSNLYCKLEEWSTI